MELSTCRSVATSLTSLAENAECKQFISLERACLHKLAQARPVRWCHSMSIAVMHIYIRQANFTNIKPHLEIAIKLYLRVENFDLTPAHACGPISHTWLKNVSCCRLAWHNFQKYVNSDPCKERKPCVKWINDNTFLTISDFWSEKHWERARFYTCPKTGTR